MVTVQEVTALCGLTMVCRSRKKEKKAEERLGKRAVHRGLQKVGTC
jgi:hypothetical protein